MRSPCWWFIVKIPLSINTNSNVAWLDRAKKKCCCFLYNWFHRLFDHGLFKWSTLMFWNSLAFIALMGCCAELWWSFQVGLLVWCPPPRAFQFSLKIFEDSRWPGGFFCVGHTVPYSLFGVPCSWAFAACPRGVLIANHPCNQPFWAHFTSQVAVYPLINPYKSHFLPLEFL